MESLDASGWTISKPNVDAPLPIMAENLARLPESVPVILCCLDKNGDLVSFTRSKKDQLHHVVGDLVVTPFSLLSVTLDELDRVIAACGNRRIYILVVLPRYFLKPYCEDTTHCANVCRHDAAPRSGDPQPAACEQTERHAGEISCLGKTTVGWETWWTASMSAGEATR